MSSKSLIKTLIKIVNALIYFQRNVPINQLKDIEKILFDSIIMLRFGKTKVREEEFYGSKKTMDICDVNVNIIIISNLVETKNNSKYLIGYLDEVTQALVLILPKMSGYVETFKVKDGDENGNSKLMSFHINDENLLGNYKTIQTKD